MSMHAVHAGLQEASTDLEADGGVGSDADAGLGSCALVTPACVQDVVQPQDSIPSHFGRHATYSP